jgi:hypothetical protein
MTDEMEKLIDIYYEDSIELPDGRLLNFKRIPNHNCTYRRAVRVSLEDLETETTIELGTYFDARWEFTSPMNERIFWQYVKSHTEEFRDIFDRLRIKIPGKEFHAYKIKFQRFSDTASSGLDRLTQIFKS